MYHCWFACVSVFLVSRVMIAVCAWYCGLLESAVWPSTADFRSLGRATINQHPLPGKDHHHQNSAETQTGEGCIPPSWQARPGGFGTTAFRPQQAQRTHAQETKNRSFPQRVLWWGGPDNRACSSDMYKTPTRANRTLATSNSASPEIIWGAWRTWRRPPTSSLLLDWSCKWTRRRRRRKSVFLQTNTCFI